MNCGGRCRADSKSGSEGRQAGGKQSFGELTLLDVFRSPFFVFGRVVVALFEFKWLDAAGEDHWFEAHQAKSLAVAPLGWRREEGVATGHLLLLRIVAAVVVVTTMMTSKNRFLEGRPDFVHRPAASLATLDFQNDFFVVLVVLVGCFYPPPPELNHKGNSLGATQDSSLLAVVDGADFVRPQKGPQLVANLGDLAVSNNQRGGQSGVDFRELGNMGGIDSPPAPIGRERHPLGGWRGLGGGVSFFAS